MSRPNSKWFIVPALLLAVVAVACGGGEEKTLLTKYFMASKVSDNMTLSNIATVSFDPKLDGQMQSFSIVSVSPEKSRAAHAETACGGSQGGRRRGEGLHGEEDGVPGRQHRGHRPHCQGRGQEPAGEGQGRGDPEGMEQVA